MKKILSFFTAMALVFVMIPSQEASAATVYYNKGTSGVPVWTTNSAELSQANWADNSPIVRETDTGGSVVTATVEDADPTITGFLPATIARGANLLSMTISGSNFPASGLIDSVYVDDPAHSSLNPAGTVITVPNENTIGLDFSALNGGLGLDTAAFPIGSWRVGIRLTDGSIYKSDLATLFTVNAPASAGPVLTYQSPNFENSLYVSPIGFGQTFVFGVVDSDSNSIDYTMNNQNANTGAWTPASDTGLDTSGGQTAYYSTVYTYSSTLWQQQIWNMTMTDGTNPTNTSSATFYSKTW